MSNLQLIEALCGLVESFSRIVRRLAAKLEQINALEEAERQEVHAAFDRYSKTIGANELPDVECTSSNEYHVAYPNIRIEELSKEDDEDEEVPEKA